VWEPCQKQRPKIKKNPKYKEKKPEIIILLFVFT
jgi:hypothetical protein